jgi:hypothetical protein
MHGIMPRRWLAEGISRSTWFRRRAKARQQAARAAILDRLDWQMHELRGHLAWAATAHAVMARELDTAYA